MSDSDTTKAVAVPGLHDLVWVRGPDTVGFLDGLVSQDVAAMPLGGVAHSLLLAPNGKLRAPLVLWRGNESVGLVTSQGAGSIVSGDLSRFKIRVDAVIEPDARPTVTLVGDDLGALLQRAGLPSPEGDAWTSDGATVGAIPFVNGGPGRVLVVGVEAARLGGAGAEVGTRDAVEALRIERGEPIVGRDVDESTIPQEMGAVDHAVSFTKGCYLGQELVARIDSRGRVNKHLRGIVVAAGAHPPSGAELVSGDTSVGRMTSFATSDRLQAGVGLALVRREVSPGSTVTVRWEGGETQGSVEALPLG